MLRLGVLTGGSPCKRRPYVVTDVPICPEQSQFGSFFGGPCRQGPVQVPSLDLQWSCGLSVNGQFTCSGNHLISRTVSS